MSRRLLLMSALLAALVACGQPLADVPSDLDPIPALKSGALGQQPTVGGQIPEWVAGKTAIIKLDGLSEEIGKVEADGRWSFTLPTITNPDVLRPARWLLHFPFGTMDQVCSLDTIEITPPDAKLASWTSDFGVEVSAQAIGAQLSPRPFVPGLKRQEYAQGTTPGREVQLVYAPQATQIRGQRVCRVYPWPGSSTIPNSNSYIHTLAVNLDLQAGWNDVNFTGYYVVNSFTTQSAREVLSGGAGEPSIPWTYVGPR